MSVIAEIGIPATEFELGRIVECARPGRLELESLVPVADRTVPYLWVYGVDFDAFEQEVTDHPAVADVAAVDRYEDRALYSFDWAVENDAVLGTVGSVDACVLTASGSNGRWEFELRFPAHDALSQFRNRCRERGVSFDVERVRETADPDGPWYGLTEPQREALVLAVESGYYDIPRECTTAELADRLGISDQAVTERLRRAIVTLSSSTVLDSPGE